MTELLRIRKASIDDAGLLSLLGCEAFRDAYGETAPKPDIERHVESYFGVAAIRVEMQRPDVEYFVAVHGGECVGLAKLRAALPPVDVAAETALEVQQLYVSSSYQRKGLGRRLMDRVVQTARNRGVDGVWLSVWSQAQWATAFYRGYGFNERGTVPFYLGETEHIDYVMWLPTAP